MKQTEKTVNQITEGIIWKQLLYFFFPILLGTFFQQLYNTADAMVVGRFVGKEALACVGGSSSQIINLIVGFFVGLSSGATVIIAQYYGARDEKNLQDTLHTAIAFSIVGSFVISILGIVLSPIILRLMNTPEYLMADSLLYLRFYFGGIIFIFIYNIGSGILRAVGDSKNPLYLPDLLLLLQHFPGPSPGVMVFHMGVLGVALGTLISQALSSVLILRNLMRTKDIYRLELRKIRLHAAPLSMLLKIGLPSGLQSTMYNIANMVIQTALNSFGTDTMAAWTAFGKVDSFYWMISSAFGVAITTFVGQNYGAGKIDRMKKSVRVCFCMDLATALTLSALMYLFLGKFLLSLFTTDAEVLSIGVRIMQIIVPAYAPFVFIEIFSGALRGAGNVLIPMLLTCGGICVTRILWIFFFVPSHRAVETIIFSYPGSWVLTATLFILYFAFYTRRHWGRGATRDLK
ncbi:MAG: MATE family efflux transporter [Lachnospiraceae bacterium]